MRKEQLKSRGRFVQPGRWLLLAFIATALFRPACDLYAQDYSALYDRLRQSIVSIECSGLTDDDARRGTGFFITSDGVIVTNYHVVDGAVSWKIKDNNGNQWTSVSIIRTDEGIDLAAVKVSTNSAKPVMVAPRKSYKVGQRVVAIGNPLGLDNTISDGIISAFRRVSDEIGDVIQITTPISPGSSGGPLVSLSGEVIGVTSFQVKVGQNLNFAIPVWDFVNNLSRAGTPRTGAGDAALPRLNTDDLLETARACIETGRRQEAKERYSAVLRTDRDNFEALFMMASIYIEEWDSYNANVMLKRCLDLGVANAYVFHLQGNLFKKMGQVAQAIDAYEVALAYDANLAGTHYELALLYSRSNNQMVANIHLDQLQKLDPNLYAQAVKLLRLD